MAVDVFLHDKSGIDAICLEMTKYLTEYKEHINALDTLVNTINNSTAWEDKTVKTSFINTVKSYINAYNSLATGIEAYINCLNKKSENISENEELFS